MLNVMYNLTAVCMLYLKGNHDSIRKIMLNDDPLTLSPQFNILESSKINFKVVYVFLSLYVCVAH